MEFISQVILFGGVLVLMSVVAGAISPRVGMPLLLVFLAIGMLAGEDGPGGLVFDDFELALLAGSLGLAVILFDGGLRTDIRQFRVGLRPALSLATLGVALTAVFTAVACMLVFELTWLEALLMGSIVASTDAAAVFALLGRGTSALNQRVSATLEIESGSNDPMAIFLTVMFVGLIASGAAPDAGVLWDFAWQMGVAALMGIAGGLAIVFLINRLTLTGGLYPLLALSGAAVLFGAVQMSGASGFLAVYLAGIVVGNRRVQALHNIQRFHDGVAWLAQIGLFLILGLLVTPSELLTIAPQALVVAVVLIVFARPVAVVIGLLPFRFKPREQAFISWVGLRGAVPIVLAMFPLVYGLENARLFFNVAFFIVLVSLVVQGWTVALAARLARVEVPGGSRQVQRVELELPGQLEFEIVGYRIDADSPALGSPADAAFPKSSARPNLVVRDGALLDPDEAGALRAGDYLYLVAKQDDVGKVDRRLVAGIGPDAATGHRFYGEFQLDPSVRIADVLTAYNLELPDGMEGSDVTVAEFLAARLPNPVAGDRVPLGPVTLVVAEMDGARIVQVGLKV